MKKQFILLLFFCFISFSAFSYDNLMRAQSDTIYLDLSEYKYPINLRFASEFNDTVTIKVDEELFRLTLLTDIDSIGIHLSNGNRQIIGIQKPGMPVAIVDFINRNEKYILDFDTIRVDERITFKYDEVPDSDFYTTLKTNYPIDSIVSEANDQIGKIRKISSWVQGLWQHDGNNEPKERNTLYVLEAVKRGERFRCVEYGMVTTSCLNSLGIPSRSLSLKTKYVETGVSGEGHVLMEAFLTDLNKWVMVDPQWDAIPHVNGYPLNAVELQEAINNNIKLDFWTNNPYFDKQQYVRWIYPYLFYFDVSFDNRENISSEERLKVAKRVRLMLIPKGINAPKVFQRGMKLNYLYYTNSTADFYLSPFVSQ